jgi:hypothetical protein
MDRDKGTISFQLGCGCELRYFRNKFSDDGYPKLQSGDKIVSAASDGPGYESNDLEYKRF